jgi:two-component system phosphate regulon sensor histidine kinase PhoR
MGNSWSSEVWRLVGLLVLGLLIGFAIGQVSWTLFVITAVYLVWHLRNLYKLDQWLQGKRAGIPNAIEGAWANVYHHLYRLQQRNRRRKKKLASMVNRFRESTNALPDAAVVLDENGNIENWNKSAAKLLNLRKQDAHRPITNLIRHPEFIQCLNSNDFSGNMQMSSPIHEDMRLSIRVVPYGNKQRLLMVRDITRLHKLEQMRQDFIANVSHELRTPLTVVSGYLESILDDEDDWVRENEGTLKAMLQQSMRMQNIVTDLLLLSRLETEEKAYKKQNVDVPAMLKMIKEDGEALSNGRHTFQLDADPALWLHASGQELISVFSNLIYNAVKYTPEGGRINIRWFADEQGAHFEVEDTGVGIAPQHIPRLTERFYRVDVGRSRATGGTGLGLAIVKHVLGRHDATLEIHSELDQGSTFRCHFPASLILEREVA